MINYKVVLHRGHNRKCRSLYMKPEVRVFFKKESRMMLHVLKELFYVPYGEQVRRGKGRNRKKS